jgi:phage repressor protein C with HTH and peptisase S24 domain
MLSPSDRLKQARIAAGYASAQSAARAMGAAVPTYAHHENGGRGMRADVARRYAAFFRVSLDWLLTGRGEMRAMRNTQVANIVRIPVDGLVGAGAAVEQIGVADPLDPGDWAELQCDPDVGAFVVVGASQWPRFLEGETVLYDRRPVLPQSLIGRYAIVQTADGRRLLKILKRGARDGMWTLASHNAPDEENVTLIGAWRYLGVLARLKSDEA